MSLAFKFSHTGGKAMDIVYLGMIGQRLCMIVGVVDDRENVEEQQILFVTYDEPCFLVLLEFSILETINSSC
jgi:hypothetical protein